MKGAGLLVVVSVSLLVAAVPAAARGSDVVVDSDRSESRRGRVVRDDPRLRDVPECRTAGCDRAEVAVRLPARLRDRPGGVEPAIRTVGATPDDSLGFAVYRDGRRVALADAQIGTSRSVWLPKTAARYTVNVFQNPFVPELASRSVRYEGLVEDEDSPVEPANRLRELDEGDNCVRVPVTLTGLTTGAPVAALGSPAVPCG